jgi:hypothetical protein
MFVFLTARSMNAWSKLSLILMVGVKAQLPLNLNHGGERSISHSDKKEPRYPLHRKLAEPYSCSGHSTAGSRDQPEPSLINEVKGKNVTGREGP